MRARYGAGRLVLNFIEGLSQQRKYLCRVCLGERLRLSKDDMVIVVDRLLDENRINVFRSIKCTDCGGTPVVIRK